MTAERIEKAQGELKDGKLGRALGSLIDIKDSTRDPEMLRQVQTLAEEGLAQAGRFSKGSWKNLISDTTKKISSVEPAAALA